MTANNLVLLLRAQRPVCDGWQKNEPVLHGVGTGWSSVAPVKDGRSPPAVAMERKTADRALPARYDDPPHFFVTLL
jgi:hypothetical protein